MKRSPFSRLLLVAICLFALFPGLQANAKLIQSYGYPYPNGTLSTATYALLKGVGYQAQVVSVELNPARQKTPLLEGRAAFTFDSYLQKGAAPLIFIVPGLGGHATSGASRFVSDQFYRAGYHVVIVNSPLNWSFVLANSGNGAGGITEDDSKDLYRALQIALREVKSRFGTKVRGIGLVGWSLGALESGFIAKMDATEKKLGIAKTLMINPPVNLLYGARSLDHLQSIGDSWSSQKRSDVQSYAFNFVMNHLQKDIRDPGYFAGLDRQLRLSEDEVKYVMGNYFESSIGEALFVSQQIRDMGILPTRDPYNRARMNEAMMFGFMDYIEKVAARIWAETRGSTPTLEEMNQASSLTRIEDFLRANDSVHLMHNADDFLLAPGDAAYLDGVFGDRAMIYPVGGHVGNIWYKDNVANLLSVFSSLLP